MKTSSSRLYSLVYACLPLVLLTAGCEKKEAPPTERPPTPVQVEVAKAKAVPLYIDTIGQTTAYNAVSIQPQVSGQLMKIHFKQGANVKKGDLLFTIDEAPYKAKLDAAKAQLAKDQADLEINQKQLERSKVLLPKKYVSEQTYEGYEANVNMLKAAIAADKAAIKQAQIDLGYCRIAAPTDGMVGNYLVNEGNIVQAANPAVLTTIRQLDPLYVDFVVPAAQLPGVRDYLLKSKDGTLDVEVSAQNGHMRKHTGKLKVLGNQVARATGTVNLRAELENKDFLFWPSEPVQVRLILTQLENTVLVPEVSVRYNQQGSYVWTVENGIVKLSMIELGQSQEGRTHFGLKSGVKAGDTVVTAGALMLQPGSKVAIVDPKAQAAAAAQQAQAAAEAAQKQGEKPAGK